MRKIIAATAAGALLGLMAGRALERPRVDAWTGGRTQSRAPIARQDDTAPAGPVTHAGTADSADSASDAGWVTTQLGTVAPQLEAYGQIEPVATSPVNAAEQGVVTGLKVLPGMHVRAGEQLAELTGPAIESLLGQSEADVRSASAQLNAAQKTLAIDREQLPAHLSTRAMVQQAEGAAAQAQTNFENAQSRLRAVRQMMTLSAPADGTVLALNASNGELAAAGQAVLTLQTAGRLWLEASYYGPDLSAIRIGMSGVFTPADGSPPVRVRVRSVSGAMSSGAGEAVGLMPVGSPARWINGEYGRVTLRLPAQRLVSVPTRALILDRGKWWVLVHTPQGEHPQEVVPGPSQGWNTFLESGLAPGAQVVVENAYLSFHRGVSKRYQPPDN